MKKAWVTRSFEVTWASKTLLAALSLAGAVTVYTWVQTLTQEHLIDAYLAAEFHEPFCDEHVALPGELCGRRPKMSWQQMYTLLVAARIVDPSEVEDGTMLVSRLARDGAHDPLFDLMRTLGGKSIVAGEAANDANGARPPPHVAEDYACAPNDPECKKTVGSGTEQVRPGLAFIRHLAQAQCQAKHPGVSSDKTRSIEVVLAWALADALGGGDFTEHGRCANARQELDELMILMTKPRVEVPTLPVSLSGWRFSTARCLSDGLILGHLIDLHGAVGFKESHSVGYNITGCRKRLDPAIAVARFESFTKLMQYVLGRVHADPSVRRAQKRANFLRGPEHVAILAVAFFVTGLIGLRGIAVERRFRRAARGDASGESLRRTARVLAVGREGADREHENLARGRVFIQWGIATIPAFGFIGTVRGILEALSKTGDVVWAANRLERASAIGELAGELGLAFSTTLMALLMGVAVGLLFTVTRVREGRWFDRLADWAEEKTRAE